MGKNVMSDKQKRDAKTLKTLKTLKQLIAANCTFNELPEIYQLREQLNECVRSYEYHRSSQTSL